MPELGAVGRRRVIEVTALGVAALLAAGVGLAVFLADRHVRFTLIGGVALAFVFAVCGNIRLGMLWALVFTAPIGLCKRFMTTPNMGGASGFQFDACDVFLFPLAFLILREMQLGLRRRSEIEFPLVARWWLALAAAGIVTLVAGPFRTLASFEVARMLKLLLLLLVVANEVARPRQFRHICAALMLSLIVQSSLAIMQYVLQRPIGLEAIGEASAEEIDALSKGTLRSKEFVFRVSAILGHANFLATFIAAQLPLALALLFTRTPLRLRLVCGLALVLGGTALILTLSRTGWLAGGAALLGVMLLTLFHPRLRVQFPLGRVAFFIGVFGLAVGFSGKIGARLFQSDEGAVDFRWELLEVAWKMGESNPLFGRGLNSFVFQMPPFTRYGSPDAVTAKFGQNWPVVHNVYALIWAEMGAVGAVLFLGFCGSLIAMGIRMLRTADELSYAIGAAGLMAFVVFLLDWLASFTLRNDNMARVLFVIIGMVVAAGRLDRTGRAGAGGASGNDARSAPSPTLEGANA